MSYNGWTNRETWLVNIWFGDDDYLTDMSAAEIQNVVAEYVEEKIGESGGFIYDMINFECIDWDELADHHKSDDELEDDDDTIQDEDDEIEE